MTLDNLALFLRIIEKGGLAAAGREIGMSPASVSERLASLEAHYGVTLLSRTTRAINLTDEGRTLADGARILLAESQEVDARVRLGASRVSGPIRISAPEDLGRRRLVPMLDGFLEDHPDVTIDLNLTDGVVDLVGQGLDFAVRFGILADSSLRARPLSENRRVVCASPRYLEERGTPLHPEELANHDCLTLRLGQNPDRDWPFMINGRLVRVVVRGQRTANDGGLIRDWCVAGRGIALKSVPNVEEELASGALIEILRPFSPGPTALQVVYAPSAVQPRRVRLLIDRLVAEFGRRKALQPASAAS